MDKIIEFLKSIKLKQVYVMLLMIVILAIVVFLLYGLVQIIQARREVASIALPDLDASENKEEDEVKAFDPPEELVVELVSPDEERNPVFKTDEEKLEKNEELFYEQLVIEGRTHIVPPENETPLPEVEDIDPEEAIKKIEESNEEDKKSTSSEKEYNKNDMAHIVKSELEDDEFSELVEDIMSDDVIDDFDYQSVQPRARRNKVEYDNEVIEDSSFDDMLENILIDDEENV